MIVINQVKLEIHHTTSQLYRRVSELLHIRQEEIISLEIIKRSVDSRKKPMIFFSYTVAVAVKNEAKLPKAGRKGVCQWDYYEPVMYQFPENLELTKKPSIVIVGAGPAGLFCGYLLARAGLCPILLERGKDIISRQRDVDHFWTTGELQKNSNVQFGEGGAGTFSDGKLNTVIKDKTGRNKAVLETFVKHGADPEILIDHKPHIGTDVLSKVILSMREEIISLGGQVRFESQFTDYELSDQGGISTVTVNNEEKIPCDYLVLAIGHSARDTFYHLYEKKLPMEQKPFAVGFRVEHLQSMINESQYGCEYDEVLGAANYKVTYNTEDKRGVYSFCMCPGGYVVNASSEENRLAVNGMSYSGRQGRNANSAIVVGVDGRDFGADHPLAGLKFCERLEENAYKAGRGKIPVQRYGDFKEKRASAHETDSQCALMPQQKGQYTWTSLEHILPEYLNQYIVDGMEHFGKIISGFSNPETILSGVESRTSSPIKLLRDPETLESSISGLYPCGEGGGYAGGITSAAMDGMKVGEKIIEAVKIASGYID